MDVMVFSQAKDASRPEDNEDRSLVIDGRAYGVIDGVTDKTGRRFDGLTGGQIAGRVVEAAVRDACTERDPDTIDGPWLIERINRDFAATYARLGLDPADRETPVAPFAAQLVLALVGRETMRFLMVGDAGLRLNGHEVFRPTFPMDVVGTAIRKAVWRHVTARGADHEIADLTARTYTVAGLGALVPEATRWLDDRDLAHLRREIANEALAALPEVSSAVLGTALGHGMREQHRYANRLHPLGFPTLNGRPVPPSMVVEFRRDLAGLETVELFSDGYFGCPLGTDLDDWEEWFARVEAEDPAKVDRHASTKGSFRQRFADDRTVVILRCDTAGTRPSPDGHARETLSGRGASVH